MLQVPVRRRRRATVVKRVGRAWRTGDTHNVKPHPALLNALYMSLINDWKHAGRFLKTTNLDGLHELDIVSLIFWFTSAISGHRILKDGGEGTVCRTASTEMVYAHLPIDIDTLSHNAKEPVSMGSILGREALTSNPYETMT